MRLAVRFVDRVGVTQEALALLAQRQLNLAAVEMAPPYVYIEASAVIVVANSAAASVAGKGEAALTGMTLSQQFERCTIFLPIWAPSKSPAEIQPLEITIDCCLASHVLKRTNTEPGLTITEEEPDGRDTFHQGARVDST